MPDELRTVARPTWHPAYPHFERCPECGEDGHSTERCFSHAMPDSRHGNAYHPLGRRDLRCGACGHVRELPREYQPLGEGDAAFDFVAWRAAHSRGLS